MSSNSISKCVNDGLNTCIYLVTVTLMDRSYDFLVLIRSDCLQCEKYYNIVYLIPKVFFSFAHVVLFILHLIHRSSSIPWLFICTKIIYIYTFNIYCKSFVIQVVIFYIHVRFHTHVCGHITHRHILSYFQIHVIIYVHVHSNSSQTRVQIMEFFF